MNAIKLISTLVAGLTIGGCPAVKATDWADFSQSKTSLEITSQNQEDTTVLQTVAVVCPVKGYLIAQAESQFNLVRGFLTPIVTIGYGLTLDSVAPIAFDISHFHYLDADASYETSSPGSIQGIVSCTAGQSITINFVAWILDYDSFPGGIAYALQPKLSVDFFEKRI
jgi:hypothetical protein